MSPSRPAHDGREPEEPEQNHLDAELEALIADYRRLHQDDARLRRIERIIHAAHRSADEEGGDRAGEIRE